MGPMKLTNSTAIGTVNTTKLNVQFSLNGRSIDYIPEWIQNDFDGAVPNFQSHFGMISKCTVDGVNILPVPMVYSTYPIKIGLEFIQWNLISALQFKGTDLQVEVVAMNIENIWVAVSYIFFEGKEYKLNNPLLFDTSITKHGEVQNDNRVFAAEIDTLEIGLKISCSAPTSQFALLDKEGLTFIRTTVMGVCTCNINGGGIYSTTTSSLLELKEYPSNK